MATQRNPNTPHEDDVRRERGAVGVYDDNEQVADRTTATAAGTPGADPMVARDVYNEPRTASQTEPASYQTAETSRRGGASLATWITIAIIAIIILWLLFTFIL